MTTAPLAPTGPDPYDDDDRPRSRWLAPALIGLSIGVLFGGAGVFVVMSLAGRTGHRELTPERFDVQAVLFNTPGGDGISPSNSTEYLGAVGRRANSGSSVLRRITLSGAVRPGADVSTLGQSLKTQVEAELNRHGAFVTGGGSSGFSSNNEYRQKWHSGYYTRDGRRGHMEGEIVIRQGMVEGLIIITEGR